MKNSLSIIIALLCLLTHVSVAQTNHPEKASTLDSLYSELYSSGSFNGNILIAENGKIIFEKSYGLADEAKKRELNVKTVFELASVSKQFTAMGIVLLKKRGKLKYDDPISKYIPELAFYGNITIRNLLNHTSGLPDYMELFEKNWDKTKFATNEDIINELVKYKPPLYFQPNEKWDYSNTGYALLASITERVSKMSFGKFLKENIFHPLKMDHTLVYRSRYAPQEIKNYALGYVTDSLMNKVLPDSFGKESQTYYLDGIVGDGMVNSNLEDLLKWDRALYTDQLVNASDRNELFSFIQTTDGKDTNYGFGWKISNNEKYGKIVNHSGSWGGYITFIERHLDNDKTVIVLQNNETPMTKISITEVRKILYNEELNIKTKNTITPKIEDLNKYTGIYSNSEFPLKITIFRKDNQLIGRATDQNPFPLEAYENHTFKFEPAGLEMVFNPDENSMNFEQGKTKLVFIKE